MTATTILSTPADVAAALAAPDLSVVPPPAGHGPAADLIGRMARFSDGAAHRRRRELTVRLLPPVAEIAARAAERTAHYLREPRAADALAAVPRATNVLDVMPLARTVPAEALARALGLGRRHAASAADLTGRLCDALAATAHRGARAGARRGAPARASDADEAASALCAALRSLGLSDDDEVAAAASILFQARDATAALIGLTVLASAAGRCGRAADRVERVLRREPPVQFTRRTAVVATTIGAAVIPRGSDVRILLTAATAGTPGTFGDGPHACPGATAATVIAREFGTVLDADGWRPVPGQRVDYEPRPNLRLPCRVLVTRP